MREKERERERDDPIRGCFVLPSSLFIPPFPLVSSSFPSLERRSHLFRRKDTKTKIHSLAFHVIIWWRLRRPREHLSLVVSAKKERLYDVCCFLEEYIEKRLLEREKTDKKIRRQVHSHSCLDHRLVFLPVLPVVLLLNKSCSVVFGRRLLRERPVLSNT